MKKALSLLFSVSLLLSITVCMSGCNDEDKITDDKATFDYTTNYQYYYSNLNGTCFPITKSETGYYVFSPNNFLYYIDRELQEATLLCDKPNCSHSSADCNAYFNLFVQASSNMYNIIQYYDGNLYVVLKEQDDMGNFLGNTLYKVTPDGSTREKLLEFKEGISHWLIHKGYFYFSQDIFSDNVDYGSVYDSFAIKRCPIDNINKEPEEIFNSKNYSENLRGTYQFTAYGDNIYVPVRPITEHEIKAQEESGKIKVSTYQEFYSVDINSMGINQIKNDEGDVLSPFFYNGKLTYLIFNSDTDDNFRYFTSDPDGSNPKFLAEMNYGDNLFANESQLYLQSYVKKTDENAENDSGGNKFKLLDSSFNEISSFVIPFNNSLLTVPQDSECFIFVEQIDNSNFEIYFVDKSKTDSLKGQTAEYKTVFSSLNSKSGNSNQLDQVDPTVKINTTDNELNELFANTQNKLYKISAEYDKSVSDDICGGFSVTLYWSGDGGNYTAHFQILKFKTDADAEKFFEENPYSLVNGQYIAFVSLPEVPIEIKDMLDSIINNNPISPIDSTDFSGELYSFN